MSQKRSYICSKCKKPGHNSRTCITVEEIKGDKYIENLTHWKPGEDREIIRGLKRDDAFLKFIRENYEVQLTETTGPPSDPEDVVRKKLIRKRDQQLLNVWEVPA